MSTLTANQRSRVSTDIRCNGIGHKPEHDTSSRGIGPASTRTFSKTNEEDKKDKKEKFISDSVARSQNCGGKVSIMISIVCEHATDESSD